MDKEAAKFLLGGFRPDGADADMPEFAEALKLAVEDRELGEWLANERALDAEFATALNGAEIPAGLRDEILAVLEFDGAGGSDADEFDGEFIGALASMSAPVGLRDQILNAMSVGTEEVVEEDKVIEGNFWKWVAVAAIAAVVAVGAFVSIDTGFPGGGKAPRLAMNAAQFELAQVMNDTTDIQLMAKGSDCATGLKWLESEQLPVPKHMPVGLEDSVFMGCKDVVLKNGIHASLLCFKKEGFGMVHLFVFDADDISDFGELKPVGTIDLKACYSCKKTKFNMLSWREGDAAFMLLTRAKREEMMRLF